MKLSSPKTITFVFLPLCVVGIFIFYSTKTDYWKREADLSVVTTNNEQIRNRAGENGEAERDEPRNHRVENSNRNVSGYGRSLDDRKTAQTEESMRDRLVKELQELDWDGKEKDKVQEWIRGAWGKTESSLSAYRIDNTRFSLDDELMDKSSSIGEGLATLFESRGKSGSQLLDLAYSRGLLLSLLFEIDRPAFDETLQTAIQNRGVEENINLLAILFNPRQVLDVEEIEFRVVEGLVASENELPQIIALGLIDLYLQLGLEESEARTRKLKTLLGILGGRNWVEDEAIAKTRQSLIKAAQGQIVRN